MELEVEGLGDRSVSYVVVAEVVLGWLWFRRVGLGVDGRWTDASAGDDKVVLGAHAAHGFHDVFLIVGDDFHALQLDAEAEAELG